MKKTLIGVGVLVILLTAMGMMCPNRESHVTAVTESLDRLQTDSIGEGEPVELTKALVLGLFLDEIVDERLSYHNYLLFSTSSIRVNKQDRTIGWGVFGYVFTLPSVSLEELMNEEPDEPDDSEDDLEVLDEDFSA